MRAKDALMRCWIPRGPGARHLPPTKIGTVPSPREARALMSVRAVRCAGSQVPKAVVSSRRLARGPDPIVSPSLILFCPSQLVRSSLLTPPAMPKAQSAPKSAASGRRAPAQSSSRRAPAVPPPPPPPDTPLVSSAEEEARGWRDVSITGTRVANVATIVLGPRPSKKEAHDRAVYDTALRFSNPAVDSRRPAYPAIHCPAPPGIENNAIASTLRDYERVKLLGKTPWQNGEQAWDGSTYGPNENGLLWWKKDGVWYVGRGGSSRVGNDRVRLLAFRSRTSR